MDYDYSKLNGKIVEVFGSQLKFGEAMKWSSRTTSLKLNNRVPWKQPEMQRACELLKIPIEEMRLYFFCLKGSNRLN